MDLMHHADLSLLQVKSNRAVLPTSRLEKLSKPTAMLLVGRVEFYSRPGMKIDVAHVCCCCCNVYTLAPNCKVVKAFLAA